MTDLEARFRAHWDSLGPPAGPLVVAVSGGPDSLALLHLLHRAGAGPLIAAHVDHGIHPDSALVARGVGEAAAGLGVRCESVRLELGQGATETAAREARYRWLRARAAEHGAALVTAHHRDDQVETVLLRVLGGSGPAGLAGMAALSGGVLRPLLPFGREELRGWLEAAGLRWWEDPANVDPVHLRSWLRMHVMRELRARLPDLDRRILGVASQARADREAWDAALDRLPLEPRVEGREVSLGADALATLPDSLGQAVLQAAARRVGLVLGPRAATRALTLARRGASGRRADLTGGWMAELSFGRLTLRRPAPGPAEWSVRIAGERGEAVEGGWRIRWEPGTIPERQGRAGFEAWLDAGEYQVRPWRAGDRIRPLGGTGSRLVVRLFQEAKVGRARRAGWPIVWSGTEAVWVPGVAIGRAGGQAGRRAGLRVLVEACEPG